MDLANFTSDTVQAAASRVRTTAGEVAPMNVKIGLRNNVDAQVIYTPYQIERTHVAGTRTIAQHAWFATITPRVKFNLAGNDGGPFAVALMPFVSLPIGDDDPDRTIEGGVGVPYSFDVPGWDLGLQSLVRVVRRAANGDTHVETDHSISAGRKLIGQLSAFGEFFATTIASGERSIAATTNAWVTYRISGNWRLDGGVYIGVTESADDWHPWVGMTWRY
jgi:hypothetical protein